MNIRTKELLKFILNLIFAIYSFILGFTSYSWWFAALGAYYIILSVMRISVIAFSKKDRKNESFIMRFSGVMIFILSIVLCGIVYMTIEQLGAVKYHEIAMITIALYAFLKIMDMTLRGFLIYSFSFLFAGFAIFGSGFFTALNDGLTSALISFLRTLVFQIAAVLVFPLIWGLDGIWISIVLAEVMAVIITVIFLIIKQKKYKY